VNTQDPACDVLSTLVHHLHAFVKDVELGPDEWMSAIHFLTETGQTCTDTRPEFILLSDVLGVSMLVEVIHDRGDDGTTESTVEGPFHIVDSPPGALGDNICQDVGEPLVVTGHVKDTSGEPISGASVDVYHANAEGY
jgi:catechol 1,2-dioxygenase